MIPRNRKSLPIRKPDYTEEELAEVRGRGEPRLAAALRTISQLPVPASMTSATRPDARTDALRDAAALVERTANLSADALRLQYGEMTAQEIRTLRAVLEQQADAILRMGAVDVGDDDGDYDVA